MNNKTLRIVLALFALNSLSLYLYFSSPPDHLRPPSTTSADHLRPPSTTSADHLRSPSRPPPPAPTTSAHPPPRTTSAASEFSQHRHHLLKPWPILPSYLPWTLNPNIHFRRSCEAYFGHGFTLRVDALKPAGEPHRKFHPDGGGGWFRCFYNRMLGSSVCEGGRVRMIPEKIRMSHGGEKLESVIGRNESEELPEFEDGAFQIEVVDRSKNGEKVVDANFLERFVPRGAVVKHAMRGLIRSIRLADSDEFVCSKWIDEPTVFVSRYEYANLFHTFTDWYSAYVASRVTDLPYRPHLLFVDGHSQSHLEETWRKLFSSLTYAKNFTSPVCFRRIILAPLGYETILFKGLSRIIRCYGAPAHQLWQNPDDRRTARLQEFGEMIRAAFGLPVDRNHTHKPLNILFVRREDYLAHPRHDGKVQSRLSNEQQVFDSIYRWAPSYSGCRLNVVNGKFAHMPMKEQIRAIQDASVVIGAHGAGLTHIISAMPNTVILEIISSKFRRPHFHLIARWRGLPYHAINLQTAYADPQRVIARLIQILKGLGC